MATTAKEIETKKLKQKKAAETKKQSKYSYSKRKDEVYKLEDKNNRYVYIFQTEDPAWSKIGWNSVLIYRYILADRIKRKVNVRNDTDFGLKSPSGIVSLRTDSIAGLLDALRPLKIFKDEQKSTKEITVIDLGYAVSDEELDNFRNAEELKRERLNTLVPVAVVMPEVEAKIVSEFGLVRREVSKLSKFELDAWGVRMYDNSYKMLRRYRDMAWGTAKPEVALKDIKLYVYELMKDVSIVGRLDLMDLDMATRISAELMDIIHLIKPRLGEQAEMADVGVKKALAAKKVKR